MRRISLVILVALVLVAPAHGANMLARWTPHDRAEMRAADPVALAYLAKGWLLAGDRKRANVILDELERRGDMAYTAGSLTNLADWSKKNPADTVYTVTLVQVADAYRAAGRKAALGRALRALSRMPMVDNGGCYAYSAPDASVGCIADIGLISLAVLSHVNGTDYKPLLAYEQGTEQPDGSWWFWQDAPEGHPMHHQTTEAAHLAWSAFMLLDSPDPAVRALGQRAAAFSLGYHDTANTASYSFFAQAALEVAAHAPGGCRDAARLPAWASAYNDPTKKTQMWAAYVYEWTRSRC